MSTDAIIRPGRARKDSEGGRLAKRALLTSVLNFCCTAPVTRSVASVSCKRSGRTFLDYKVGTRPEQRGFQVRKQSCMLGNFLVNFGNFLYLLSILTACPALSLQRPILPGHSALLQAIAETIQTEKWIQTRHMPMLNVIADHGPLPGVCQTGTWQKTMRFLQHF